MKKLLLTNNSILLKDDYDLVYSDSPYIVEHNKKALYLDTLLDKDSTSKIETIKEKGYLLNEKILEIFFPKYQKRDISLFNVKSEYTNLYFCIIKLYNLIYRYSDYKIEIAITEDELFDFNNIGTEDKTIDRFVNVYYWIVKLYKIKNIKLICKNFKLENDDPTDKPINSWFLRLVDLDKKVLLFNLKKKIKFIKSQNKKIYIYNQNSVIREIEPYLYEKGVSFIQMPKINKNFNIKNIVEEKKLFKILDEIFDDNIHENTFKIAMFEICKKLINIHLEKELLIKNYLLKLDDTIKIILTNSLSIFERLILAKHLKESGFKIIEVMHGMGKSYFRKSDIVSFENSSVDAVFCFNNSEKKLFKEYNENTQVHPISSVQQTKNIRFKKFQRYYVNKMLKISDQINVFYPSCIYPYNNWTTYGFRQTDKWNYNFEKKMITLLSTINKRAIYKTYPSRCFIDKDSLVEYGKNFKNLKVISDKFDFRYVNVIGDIFILGMIGGASTVMWMLGFNKPIIYLHTNKFRHLNLEAQQIVKNAFITIDIDEDNWEIKLKKVLNKPYKELQELWTSKQSFRDQYDMEWLIGMNLHAGKLGAKFIENILNENQNKIK